DRTAGMTLQTPRTGLAVEDLVTGTTDNFLSPVAQQALSRSVPEHDALPLVQRIYPIRGLCEHSQYFIHCPALPVCPRESTSTPSEKKDRPATDQLRRCKHEHRKEAQRIRARQPRMPAGETAGRWCRRLLPRPAAADPPQSACHLHAHRD